MIPTYNGSRWLGETLAAATSQTHRNLRILVSDDASTDSTPDLVHRAAAADPRIELIRTGGRSRWIGNTNHLLDHLEGDSDYACFLMHDDLIVPEYVETLLAALRAHPSPAVAYGDMVPFSEHGVAPALRSVAMHRMRSRVGRCLAVIAERHWTVALRGLAPVSLFRSVPRPRLHGGGEYGADGPWIAALGLCAAFIRVPRPLYFKRNHGAGVTSGWRRTPHTALELTRSYGEIVSEVALTRSERVAIHGALALRRGLLRVGVDKSRLRLPLGRRNGLEPGVAKPQRP